MGDNINQNGNFLQIYLKELTKMPNLMTVIGPLHAFIQISGFNKTISDQIFFQEVVWKKVGGQHTTGKLITCLKTFFAGWRARWVAVTNEGICYTKKLQDTPEGAIDNLFFDRTIKINYGKKYTGNAYGIQINTSSRKLTLLAYSRVSSFILLKCLCQSLSNCPYIKKNRFNSFSPIRTKNYAQVFINAERYYESLLKDLNQAKHEIFIRGWWVSPELYLMRPVEKYPESRLDIVLGNAAKRGVRINMVLFKEYKSKLPNDSSYSKKTLEGLHKNIRIVRHPSKLILTQLRPSSIGRIMRRVWSSIKPSGILEASIFAMEDLILTTIG